MAVFLKYFVKNVYAKVTFYKVPWKKNNILFYSNDVDVGFDLISPGAIEVYSHNVYIRVS